MQLPSAFYKIIYSSLFMVLVTACGVPKSAVISQRSAKQFLLTDSTLSSALLGIALYDLDQEKYIYQYQSNKNFTPASNVKLFTCYAAMKYLGDSTATFNYILNADSSIVVRPLADPTFLHPRFPRQPGYAFLKKFKSIHLSYADTAVQRLGPGWAWEDYTERYSAQQTLFPMNGNLANLATAARDSITIFPPYFTNGLIVPSSFRGGPFSVLKAWDSNLFIISSGKDSKKQIPFIPDAITMQQLLADTLSVPVQASPTSLFDNKMARLLFTQKTDDLLHEMMYESDNFIAEQSLLMVGLKQWNTTRVPIILDSLLKTDFKTLPHKPRLVDASGLSRYNLCTPENFVQLLRILRSDFDWQRITTILPTGNQGTLAGYYVNYIGYIYAKTGFLGNNIGLSGYLITKKEGRRLAFSILVNHHTAPPTVVRKRIESFLTEVIEKY